MFLNQLEVLRIKQFLLEFGSITKVSELLKQFRGEKIFQNDQLKRSIKEFKSYSLKIDFHLVSVSKGQLSIKMLPRDWAF